MSLDARICGVTITSDDVYLNLEDRDDKHHAGQIRLVVLNPPRDDRVLKRLVDKEIWGSSTTIMLGDIQIAKRISYVSIEIDYQAMMKALEALK